MLAKQTAVRIFSLPSLCPAGMPLSQALEVLQLHSGVVQTALLTYSDQKPFEQDLSVDLNQDGVRLYFDPRNQRLKVLYNMQPFCLCVFTVFHLSS